MILDRAKTSQCVAGGFPVVATGVQRRKAASGRVGAKKIALGYSVCDRNLV
ncbi:hypothetical protein [Chroococcidiopsis thermalis]|uniref:hypothetical protein n=1 Tax=Chroococcidiopsis thermalis TaxID=54299 RepID=UPI0015F0E8D0|nr:hypothetical protein [Chroococcidiopsis thermalis]